MVPNYYWNCEFSFDSKNYSFPRNLCDRKNRVTIKFENFLKITILIYSAPFDNSTYVE